jgi:opacity protein-like surface antigen
MPRHLFILVLALLSASAAAQPAPAEKSEKWEFSVFYGVSSRGEHLFATPFATTVDNKPTTELRNVGLNFASGYIVGARITENLGDRFGAELEYNLANQQLRFTHLTPALAQLDVQHRVHGISYTVLVYGTDRKHKLRPYGAVGPGIAFYDAYGSSVAKAVAAGVPIKDRWQMGAVVGGGVKYRATKNTGFRFDVRDHFTGVPSYGLPEKGADQKAALLPEGKLHNWQFNVGFFYSFSGR